MGLLLILLKVVVIPQLQNGEILQHKSIKVKLIGSCQAVLGGDLYNTGSATVNVYNGYINAITGGNYGQAGVETIAGDSTVNVYGGDFSGSPRTGTKTTLRRSVL